MSYAFDDKQLEAVIRKTQSQEPGLQVGVGVFDFTTDQRYYYAQNVAFNSASAAKWIWAAAALQDNSVASLEPYAQKVFAVSSNEDAGDLIDFAGGIDAVNKYMRGIGIAEQDCALCSWNYGRQRRAAACPQLNGGKNFVTPRGALQFLESLHFGSLMLSPAKLEALVRWAKLSPRAGYGGWVGTQLTENTRSGLLHKAGWIPKPFGPNSLNELAIVPSAQGPYAIAILMQNGENFDSTVQAMESLSLEIYKILRL